MKKVYVRDLDVYLAVQAFIAQSGHSPSLRQIAKIVGLNTASTVRMHLTTLKNKGLISWNEGEPRTVRVIAPWPETTP